MKTHYNYIYLKRVELVNGVYKDTCISLQIWLCNRDKGVNIYKDVYYATSNTCKATHEFRRIVGAGYRFAMEYAKNCNDIFTIQIN